MPPSDSDVSGRLSYVEAKIDSFEESVRLLRDVHETMISLNTTFGIFVEAQKRIEAEYGESNKQLKNDNAKLSARIDVLEQRANGQRAVLQAITLIGAPLIAAIGWIISHISTFRDWIK